MELFGYLSFVGDVQEIPTQNPQYGNEPFIVREICVHSFVTGTSNGECVPFLRGMTLRLTGRQAQTFNAAVGSQLTVEYGSTCNLISMSVTISSAPTATSPSTVSASSNKPTWINCSASWKATLGSIIHNLCNCPTKTDIHPSQS
ncbi:MAG: hypothetical protein KBT39_01235 [Bacteroidales bacterium]|nr:hypothetical protein [Bacteroidales bacterium]